MNKKNKKTKNSVRNKRQLDQMAKNLNKCSKRSLDEVLDSLTKEECDYLMLKMEYFKNQNV